MSKLTEWLKGVFWLPQSDEDTVVAEANAGIDRVFDRVEDHVESRMKQLDDLMSSAVHVDVGESPIDRRETLISNGHVWLVRDAKRRHLGIPQHATKQQLADLILDDSET